MGQEPSEPSVRGTRGSIPDSGGFARDANHANNEVTSDVRTRPVLRRPANTAQQSWQEAFRTGTHPDCGGGPGSRLRLLRQIYADILWYNQLGYLEVFLKENGTRIAIFLIAFLIMGLAVYFSLRVAYRSRPVYAPDSSLQDNLNRYQAAAGTGPPRVDDGHPRPLRPVSPAPPRPASGKGAAVLQPAAVRPDRSAVRPGHQLLHDDTLPFLGFVTGFLISVVRDRRHRRAS